MLTGETSVIATGIDAAALKPTECDVGRALDLPVDTVTVDYEGREHVPDRETLAALAAAKDLYVTMPVRADGFDPLGDDSLAASLPEDAGVVAVAGHSAYLSEDEQGRAVAPRLRRAVDEHDRVLVGTEGVERLALATGAPQFELLSRSTERDLRALAAAGFDGEIAVYAPTVLSDDEDEILDSVGEYVARRKPVSRALPDDSATDSAATGRARNVLLRAARDFALVGDGEAVRERVTALREAGVDRIVGYPARGVEEFLD